MLALLPVAVAGAAGEEPDRWRLVPAFDLRLSTYYAYHDGESATSPALGANLGIELSAPAHPVSAGLFVDQELAAHDGQRNIRLAGGWFSYRLGDLEFATSGVHFAAGNASGTWMYVHKVQLEAWSGHTFAIEAIGTFENRGDPALQLVYQADLTERISLAITVGLGADRLLDFGTGTRFVWNLY